MGRSPTLIGLSRFCRRPRPHHKHQRAALCHVLLRQKRLRQLLPVEGDWLHAAVFGALGFDPDGELLAVFAVNHYFVHEEAGLPRAYWPEAGATGVDAMGRA